jgi:ABC-type glycerol-3-phosphate transport system substrate-binding protein
MKNIQIIISVIFALFILIGVFVFAGIIPSPETEKEKSTTGKVTIWGTVNKDSMTELIQQRIFSKYSSISIKYIKHPANTFADDLIEALASGTGPDLVLLPDDLIVRFSTKIEPFTPAMYPERTFRDSFLEEGELFISQKLGILALPFSVDPMVMYWNRDMFSSGNVARPPEYWDEFLTLAPILSKRTEGNDILKSAIAFGEFRNVTHAKDILALLIMQTGNPITIITPEEGIVPTLEGLSKKNIPAADEAVRFYTDFSDPQKPIYSWNRSLPESKSAFLSQDLAVYFGYASELRDIQTKNPNMNFDTYRMPQVRDLPYKKTFGKMNGVAVMKTSKNKPVAFFTAALLTSPDFDKAVSDEFNLPPVHRALLAKTPSNPFMKVFYESAIISDAWLDINAEKTHIIFQTAIDSIIAGRARIRNAVERAQAELLLAK